MKLSGLDFIKEYRSHPEKYLFMPDHTGETPSVNEYGELNLGWNAGLLEENRPFFAEYWSVDHIGVLTFSFSKAGIENRTKEELIQMCLDTYLFRFTGEESDAAEITSFTDEHGNEFYACNITVVADEDTPFAEVAPMFRWKDLNSFNKETEGKS